jgi:hypothetical protein
VRFRAEGTDHIESYFLKATAPDAQRAVWLKATIFSTAADPARTSAEAWAIAFDHRNGGRRQVAVKHTVPMARASFSRDDLDIEWQVPNADDRMRLEPGATHGAIRTGEQRIAWDLRFSGDDRPMVPYPYGWMYTGPLPSQKQVSPYPDVRFDGQVTIGDEQWVLEQWSGMQGHNWGRRHSELYAWLHCNQWEQDADLVLEAMSGRVRVGPVLMPVLSTICVRHRGVDYAFNGPRQLAGTRADIGLRRYTFSTEGKHGRIEGLFEAKVDEFVGLHYANPQGKMTHCLNSKLASGRIRFEAAGRPPLELTTKAAALEVGTLRADHGVKMHV